MYQPRTIHRQISYFGPMPFKKCAGLKHGMVFNGAGDDVLAIALPHAEHPFQGKVVRFCSTAGKYDLLTSCTDERRNLLPCLLNSASGLLPERMDARRIPKVAAKTGQHLLYNLRPRWRGSSIIKIDSFHSTLQSISR